jgi:cysteinyl-tRNA synthetase
VERKLQERERLRAEKQWQDADAVRDELLASGIQIMDGVQGSGWRVRVESSES